MATLAQVIKANPTIAALRQNYPAIADALNAPTLVNNPDAGKKTTVTTFTPISYAEVALTVGAASRKNLREWGSFIPELMAAIGAEPQSPQVLGILLTDAATNNKILPAEAAALQTIITAHTTSTEVTAPAKLATGASIAAAAGLGTITAAMVQAADVAGGNW